MAKPGMIITGAAGFLGSHLVKEFQPEYDIFAIDRQLPPDSDLSEGAGIEWFQVDISHIDALNEVFLSIRQKSEVGLLLHLAGYYDFTGEDHPDYRQSNVEGMRNVLELATLFDLKKLIFTSSVAACPFPPSGQTVNEETPPAAPPPYSQSKRTGEEMLRDYQDQIPSTIVRLAAIFTDWCEYEPLDNFLKTWFFGGLTARILGGQGQWAIPYIHMEDMVAFFRRVVERADQLEPLTVLQASPNGATTQLELYREATRSYYGRPRAAVHMPKPVAQVGIRFREMLGRMTGQMPFERSWMGDYIDLQLKVDASKTHHCLDWTPSPELDILERMSTMVQNLRQHPEEWARRRQRRIEHRM